MPNPMQHMKDVRHPTLQDLLVRPRHVRLEDAVRQHKHAAGPCWPYAPEAVETGGTGISQEMVESVLIAAQNDLFRQSWPLPLVPGRFVLAPSVASRPGPFQSACLTAVRSCDVFPSNDGPYGAHDIGFFEIDGVSVCFKIELWDEHYRSHSTEPTSLKRTRRLLTIRLVEDADLPARSDTCPQNG